MQKVFAAARFLAGRLTSHGRLRRAKSYDPTCWHKCNAFFPRRLVGGRFSRLVNPKLQRRWNGTAWEYRDEEETFDEWADRQW